jgi:hypothetical protein
MSNLIRWRDEYHMLPLDNGARIASQIAMQGAYKKTVELKNKIKAPVRALFLFR